MRTYKDDNDRLMAGALPTDPFEGCKPIGPEARGGDGEIGGEVEQLRAAEAAPRALRLTKQTTAQLLAEEIPETPWLSAPWLLQSSLALIIAPPNVGKTLIAFWLATEVAQRRLRVLIIQEEGGKRGMQKRASRAMAAAGGQGGELIDWVYAPRLSLVSPSDVVALCDEGTGYALIIVDSLARVMPGVEENDANAMGSVVAALDLVKRETGATVVGLHHTGKAKWKAGEVPSIGDGRGSGALAAGVDTILSLAPVADREDGVVQFDLHVVKQRDEEIAKPCRVRVQMRGPAATVEIQEAERAAGPAVLDSMALDMIAVIRGGGDKGVSKKTIETSVKGNNQRKRALLSELKARGEVEETPENPPRFREARPSPGRGLGEVGEGRARPSPHPLRGGEARPGSPTNGTEQHWTDTENDGAP